MRQLLTGNRRHQGLPRLLARCQPRLDDGALVGQRIRRYDGVPQRLLQAEVLSDTARILYDHVYPTCFYMTTYIIYDVYKYQEAEIDVVHYILYCRQSSETETQFASFFSICQAMW